MNKNDIKAGITSMTMGLILSGAYVSIPVAIVTGMAVTYCGGRIYDIIDHIDSSENRENWKRFKNSYNSMKLFR